MSKLHLKSKYSNEYIIDWYPLLKCNYKCSYCFVHKENKYFLPEKFMIFKDILNELSKNNDIHLRILGGEPSLIKNFNYYLEMLNKNILIEMVTNSSKDLSNLKRVNRFEYSIHYEYYEKHKNIFIKNLFVPQYKVIVINLHNEFKKNIDFYKKIILELKEYKEKYNLNFDFSINQIVKYYDKRDTLDIEWFLKQFNIEIEENSNKYFLNKKEITYLDYYNIYQKYNSNLKNCWCKVNYFKIDYNYNLKYNCSGGYNDFLWNLQEIPKFPKLKLWKCKNNFCDAGCFMDCERIIKEKK